MGDSIKMDQEDFIKWKNEEVDRLILSLVRLRKHNKTLAQYLFMNLLVAVPTFRKPFGVDTNLPECPKRGKNKEVLST